ncbi:MAG: hypothetical protein FVQ83_09355 [Chloroflexi bacterium]|nr:hypothetical protein [Chloroflexota bacterium]
MIVQKRLLGITILLSFVLLGLVSCGGGTESEDGELDAGDIINTLTAMDATQIALEEQLAEMGFQRDSQGDAQSGTDQDSSVDSGGDTQAEVDQEPAEETSAETQSESEQESSVDSQPDADGVIYRTDFEDADDWNTFVRSGNDNFEASTRQGYYYIQIDGRYLRVFSILEDLYMQRDAADVRIEIATESIAGPNRNNISLICRYTELGWYEFNMGSDGLWSIQIYDSASDSYETLYNGGSDYINLKLLSNEFAAECIGDELSFYINGQFIFSVRDSQFREGQIGFVVSTFNIAGVGVEVDWLEVSVP